MQAFDGGLKVTPEMAEILGLSKEEQDAIAKHLAEIQEEMKKLEDADTALLKQTANGVTYEVPADPQGKVIKDKLNSLLSADIGADRAELFMDYGNFAAYSDFGNFAETKKEIEITWAQQNGTPQYTIKNSFFGPNDKSQGWSSFSTSSLPSQYQKLLQGESGP